MQSHHLARLHRWCCSARYLALSLRETSQYASWILPIDILMFFYLIIYLFIYLSINGVMCLFIHSIHTIYPSPNTFPSFLPSILAIHLFPTRSLFPPSIPFPPLNHPILHPPNPNPALKEIPTQTQRTQRRTFGSDDPPFFTTSINLIFIITIVITTPASILLCITEFPPPWIAPWDWLRPSNQGGGIWMRTLATLPHVWI